MPLPIPLLLSGKKFLSLATNKWVWIIGLIISLSITTYWYKDSAEDWQNESVRFEEKYNLQVEKYNSLEKARDQLKLDFEMQIDIINNLSNSNNDLKKDYETLGKELGKLKTYLNQVSIDVANSTTDEAKKAILKEATEKVNSKISKSYACIEEATVDYSVKCLNGEEK